MKKIDFSTLKSDNDRTLEKLFLLFLRRLPTIYQNNFRKTIPFTIAEITLCNHRISKEDAKIILKEFVKRGFLDIVKYRGFKVDFTNLSKLLENKLLIEFANRYGLDVVCSPFFQQMVYTKANADAEFWLKNAPHKLGESDE